MSITIAGYQFLETLYDGSTTQIARGIRESDAAPVIIKTLKVEYPTLEQLSRLRYEYQTLTRLDLEGIVKPLALLSYHNGLALIFSDFAGEPLKKLINPSSLDLNIFLEIALQLSSIVGQLHENNIIHKDLKPDYILVRNAFGPPVNLKTLEVKIIDFSIASCLWRETQTNNNPNLLEGTLPYMSPEQTGRMNRSIDYRTDFYSLGVTFYEMLTGQLPFQALDPLELIHCHIAKAPVPLDQ